MQRQIWFSLCLACLTTGQAGCSQEKTEERAPGTFVGQPYTDCGPTRVAVATPTPTPPTQVIVPCDVTKSSGINVPTVAVVVQTTDEILWIRTVVACGLDGESVVGQGTAKTVLVNSQTVTATGSGNVSTTLTTVPGGSCGKPIRAPKQ